MNPIIVIFGANGFLGRYLTRHFTRQGREVVAIARNREGWSGDGMFLEWDGKTAGPVGTRAGRRGGGDQSGRTQRELPLHGRRTAARSWNRGVDSTRAIGRAIAGCKVPPKVWLNAGTATWYRHAEDKPQDDWLGEPGEGFSCDVARAWEEAFFGAMVPAETRKVALRIGMVLANEEATVFDVLRKLTARGLGGAMGGGTQRISWIHMEDFLQSGGVRGQRRVSIRHGQRHRAGVPDQPRMDADLPRIGGHADRSASQPVDAGDRREADGHRDRTGAEKPLGRTAAAARRRLPLALGAGGGRGGRPPGTARLAGVLPRRRPAAASVPKCGCRPQRGEYMVVFARYSGRFVVVVTHLKISKIITYPL